MATIIGLFFIVASQAQTVKVGSGSYTTAFPGTDIAGRNGYPSGTPYLIDSLKTKPIPTNDWWSAKLKNAHCDNLFNYPLTMKTVNSGLVVSYIPWGVISDIEPITVGVTSLNHNAPYISHYSDWLITMEWKDASRRFQATVGMGMPFIYFQKDGNNEASIKINTGTATISNEKIIIENAYNGADFVVYGPKGSSWTKNGSLYTSSLNGSNYWSMLMLPQNSTQLSALADSFQRFAYVEPTKTLSSWEFNNPKSTVTTHFSIHKRIHEGKDSNVLCGILPHHWSHSNDPNANYLNYTYSTVRGTLKMMASNHFSTINTFSGILPTLPFVDPLSAGFSPIALQQKINDIKNEGLATWTDSYNEGQVMNRLIQTARIAHEMGDKKSALTIHKTIKSRLENWLTHNPGEIAFLFYYNKTWSSLLGYPAGHGQDNNINDHHFHWGYFIHAAAFLEEFEPGWAKSFGAMINLLVRDAASTQRDDQMFPYLRNFNPYTGHSWANGFATFPQGNDQESTSESMQFNSSLIHWGSITQDNNIRNLGIYLYTTEQSAIQEYWFDTKQRNFSKTQQYALVSRVWGNSYDNGTFWTNDIAASYGIEMYPIHGGSFYLAHDTTYAKRLWNEMTKNTGILSNQVNDNLWHDVYWEFLAYINAPKAIELYNSFPNRNLKFGVSDAQTYHWLHSLNALGRLQPNTTANHPLAVAFKKGNQMVYVAKNDGPDTLKVKFSDGYVMTIAPRKLKTSLDLDITAHITTDFGQLYKGTAATLYFDSLSITPDSVQWYMGSNRIKTYVATPFTLTTTTLNAGKYIFYARVFKGQNQIISNLTEIIVGEQIAYNKSIATIPGSFQSGHFDEFEGGNGQSIAYIDFSTKNLGNFRTNESVDASSNSQEGAILTYIDAGEWTEYTANITKDGLYDCTLRYANGNLGAAGKLSIWLNNQRIANDITFPSTQKWETFGSITLKNIPLVRGKRVIRLQFDDAGVNLGKLQFVWSSNLPKALPVADAGGNISCAIGTDSFICDGSKSSYGHLGYLNYQWKQIYGPSKLIIERENGQQVTFKQPKEGVYKIRLIVSDSLYNDENDIFIFVRNGGNQLPEVSITSPIATTTTIENQPFQITASADDLDGSIKSVTFWLDGDSVAIDTGAPYAFSTKLPEGKHQVYAVATDNNKGRQQSSTAIFNTFSLAGNWILEPVANAMAVGPSPSSLNWWSNSSADVSLRSCLFDDVYQISKNGEFKNALGTQTWLEGWQNAGKDLCGVPVSPHDGMSIGKWYIDSITGLLVIDGKGNYLGLPKATNSGELSSGSTVPNQRNYQISLTATRLTAGINYGAGYWQFQFIRGGAVNTHLISTERMLIYPNPASSQIQVVTKEAIVGVKIFNELGSLVLLGTSSTLNVSNLIAGLYFVEVTTNTQKQVLRWIKQ